MSRRIRAFGGNPILETSDEEAHEYATAQASVPDDIADLVRKAQDAIDPDDLHADGFGPPPHVTVLWGLGDGDREKAVEIMGDREQCRARVSGVDLFKNDDYDVVIFALESDDLAAVRSQLDDAIPDNANKWDEYKPHMTVAYVTPGAGDKYADIESELIGREFDISELQFSGTDDHVENVSLEPGQVREESPMFGTDILAGETSGTEDIVRKALYPVINRSNRRIVSISEDDSGLSVLLDNGVNLMVNRGPDTTSEDSWLVRHGGDQYDTANLADIEKLVKVLKGPTTEAGPEGDEPDPVTTDMIINDPPQRRASDDAPEEKPEEKPKSAPSPRVPQSRKVTLSNEDRDYKITVTVKQPTGNRGDNRFDRVEQVEQALNKAAGRNVRVDRSTASTLSVVPLTKSPQGFDSAMRAVRKALTGSGVRSSFEVVDHTRTPQTTLAKVGKGIAKKAADMVPFYGDKLSKWVGTKLGDDVQEDTFSSDVGFTDTIPITNTKRRRKVKRSGLGKKGKGRRVNRKYEVKEAVARGTSPIMLVLRPQQIEALSAKPVWSALHESGVIITKPFKMGEEEFFEVSIDTRRKEWSQANAGVLLDEVGSIDPRVQKKVMEGVDADKVERYVRGSHAEWCASLPFDQALRESASLTESSRSLRLSGVALDEEKKAELVRTDVGIARKVLEWYDLGRDVLERMANYVDSDTMLPPLVAAAKAILEAEDDLVEPGSRGGGELCGKCKKRMGEPTQFGSKTYHLCKACQKHYNPDTTNEESTDPSAGVGGNTGGMPTGAAMGATNQGYSEEGPEGEGVVVSARNWAPESLFKMHVLAGDTPQWVYRQVVGSEGEGDQSMIVYRTPEGRVMRMPHGQIDAAMEFGAVVTPEQLGAPEASEEPVPSFDGAPGAEAPEMQPDVETVPMVGEATDPNADKLARDATFSKALAKYQQSRDERDWDEATKQAGRVTGLTGPDLDAVLAPMSGKEKEPVMGGAYEHIVAPTNEAVGAVLTGIGKAAAGVGKAAVGAAKAVGKAVGTATKAAGAVGNAMAANDADDDLDENWADVAANVGKQVGKVAGLAGRAAGAVTKAVGTGVGAAGKELTDEAAGSEIELTDFDPNCRKCNKQLDADDMAYGKCKKCFTKIEPDLEESEEMPGGWAHPKPETKAQYDAVIKRIEAQKKKDSTKGKTYGVVVDELARFKKERDEKFGGDDSRKAEAVRRFSVDDEFNGMMDKFEVTRNEGYLIRATERASRVGGIPLNEARELVEEILEASK